MNERTLCVAAALLIASLWGRALWLEHQASQPADVLSYHVNAFVPCEQVDVAVGIFHRMSEHEPFVIPLVNHREASAATFRQLGDLHPRHLYHANLTSRDLLVPGGITDRTTGAKGVYLILHMSAAQGSDDMWVEYAKTDGSDAHPRFQQGMVHRSEGRWEMRTEPTPIIE